MNYKMFATRAISSLRPVQFPGVVTKKANRSMQVVCQAKRKKCEEDPPNPYALFDSTVKMMSTPATEPIVEEMKKTNEALEKIVDILEEYKRRKLDELVPIEEFVDSNKPNDVY